MKISLGIFAKPTGWKSRTDLQLQGDYYMSTQHWYIKYGNNTRHRTRFPCDRTAFFVSL